MSLHRKLLRESLLFRILKAMLLTSRLMFMDQVSYT
jgi:hypothetical protein